MGGAVCEGMCGHTRAVSPVRRPRCYSHGPHRVRLSSPDLASSGPQVLASSFILNHQGFVFGGKCGSVVGSHCWAGDRHAWNVVECQMHPEVLEWLRAAPALMAGTAENKKLKIKFSGQSTSHKTESNRKWIRSGAMGRCSSTSMCNLSVTNPFPAQRVLDWFRAWKMANAGALQQVVAASMLAIKGLPSDVLAGDNARHFLTSDWGDWLLTCGELVVSNPRPETSHRDRITASALSASTDEHSWWAEPFHTDGGASMLHMGLTLYGRRTCRFEQGPDLEDVRIECKPGSVYLGQVTRAANQVKQGPP